MSNNVVAIKSDGGLDKLIAEIQQEKIRRIESAPPPDLRLTVKVATEYLSRSCLLKHEVIDLLFGMKPHPTETAENFSYLSPGDNVVVRRFLADEKAGKLVYPILVDEFNTLVLPWRNELPEELACALKSRFSPEQPDIPELKFRKNSAEGTRTEVEQHMRQAIAILQAEGFDCMGELPGTKGPYRTFLKRRSSRLSLADATLDDHIKNCGFRWKQSGSQGKLIDSKIEKILGL